MATTLKHQDNSTSTTALTPEAGNPLQIRVADSKGGGAIYVLSSVAANGDKTYRFNRFEPPAK